MDEILNFHALTPELATSGQPTPEQFRQIAAAGYQAVINLAMPDSEDALANEGSLVTGLGMSYHHIPVPFEAPTEAHLEQFTRLLQALSGHKVWVHCQVNARVSAFSYRYLRETMGFDEAAATTPLLRKWRPRMDPVWRAFLGEAGDPPG